MKNNKYKYTLTEDIVYINILPGIQDIEFYTSKGNLLLILNNGTLTIKAGYSWDGCTPKIKVFGKWVGTPDGRCDQTKLASCLHDALYQARKSLKGLSRLKADQLFKEELIKVNWPLTNTYYNAVRLFGGLYW